MNELCLKANAKINLFLEVLDKRPDGYHNIETIFQSVALHDVIILRKKSSRNLIITCDNAEAPSDNSNLAYKAAKLLAEESGTSYGAEIYIQKHIPVGAGLAGGSTDAAATLVGLNELWGLELSFDDLMKIGGKLGSDVPFCILGGTALGRGRGEELVRLAPLPEIPVVIANPGFQVSTAWAYNSLGNLGLTRARKNANILVGKMQKCDASDIDKELYNVFENIVMEKYPLVRQLRDKLVQMNSLGALMTGSGSSVFALVNDKSSAINICEKLRHLADFCVATKTSNTSIIRM